MGTHVLGAHGEAPGTKRLFKAYAIAGAVVLAAALAWFGFSPTAADDGSAGIVIIVGAQGESSLSLPELLPGATNRGKSCADLQGPGQSWTEFKLEGPTLTDGSYTSGPLTVALLNFTGDSFDWESNIGVDAVMVKGGNAGSYLYRYDPPAEATGDQGLTVPNPLNNGVSHISFCYDLGDSAQPAPEPTPDAGSSVTPTATPEPTPDPGSSVTPTATPEPTPDAGTSITGDSPLEPPPDAGTSVTDDPTLDPGPGPDADTSVTDDPTSNPDPNADTSVTDDPTSDPDPSADTSVTDDPTPGQAPEPGTGISDDPDSAAVPGHRRSTSVADFPVALPDTGDGPGGAGRGFPDMLATSLAALALIGLGSRVALRSRGWDTR